MSSSIMSSTTSTVSGSSSSNTLSGLHNGLSGFSMGPKTDETKHYLGLDLSTQQLKAVVINDQLRVVHESSVAFDSELPEFRTHGGVNRGPDGKTVTAPVLMWIKALDILLDKIKISGIDFATIMSISGCGQQHGSVYWKRGARQTLATLHPNRFLHDQLANSFTCRDSPVWMDSSTTKECAELENAVGGPDALAQITGSRAYERFTGSQIRKLVTNRPEVVQNAERITLVSNFLATIFLGSYAPIDLSDGSGMNLLDIKSGEWSVECLDAVGAGPELATKLGEQVVASSTVLGRIAHYFVERYSFGPECQIVAFTGDNPGSLLGMALEENELAVSLGTSDTIFACVHEPHPALVGHVFCSPANKHSYMAMVCFKNGSKTRERIRNECAEGDWSIFNELLNSTPRGNFGNMAFYYDLQEIYPLAQGDFRFNKFDEQVGRFSKEVDVRALVEGQFIRLRLHAEDMGLDTSSESPTVTNSVSILATGGGSANGSILQVLADVFSAPVYVQKQANSAALGCACMAKYALSEGKISFNEMMRDSQERELAAEPAKDSNVVYSPMVDRQRALVQKVQNQMKPKS